VTVSFAYDRRNVIRPFNGFSGNTFSNNQVPGTRRQNITCVIWRPWRQRIIYASAQNTENNKGLHCDDIGTATDTEGLENTHPTHDFKSDISEAPHQRIGAGGVITPGMDPFQHWVWQYEWPLGIQQELTSNKNRTGKLTINDLELAGLVLGWLDLEYVSNDLTYKHIGLFCDNTLAVSWAYKRHTTTLLVAGRLLRLLAIHQHTRQKSLLMPMNIAGKDNAMADIPSRAFKSSEFFHAKANLTEYFNIHFPLPQMLAW